MLKVAFDMDGVIADFRYVFKLEVLKKYGHDIDRPTRRGGKITHRLAVPDVDDKSINNMIYNVIANLSKEIYPYNDVKEALTLFYSYYDRPVTIVTARDKDKEGVKDATELWLKTHFPEIEFEVVYARHKDKAIYLKENKYDSFVEDRLKNANAIADVVRRVFLVDRIWNLGRDTKPSVIRVNSLRQAVLAILNGT